MAEIKTKDIKDGEKVYGCAFDVDFDRYYYGRVTHTFCKPVLGMVKKPEEDSNYGSFYLLKKDGTIRQSGRVSSDARHFARTYEESVQIYNQLIQNKIEKLKSIADDLEKEFL